MKKKIDPQHYATDALVTSDEWDNFDYNLRSQIKELAEIGYDEQPAGWKKNTLAYGYLWHVEKLLLERHQWTNDEIENIRELQSLIGKYDHLKTFLLALRIATIAYRNGLIPKFVAEGEAHLKYRHKQSEKAQKPRSHGDKTSAEIRRRNDQIIKDFKEAHDRNPRVKRSGFSKQHAAKYGLKSSQVRSILKPSSK